jgi:RNA polymerase sigma factor (sigma-70 family)
MTSPYGETNDAEVVRLCVQRDGLAWRELFDRYIDLMYSIPVKYGCFDPVERWDIVQNVLVTLVKGVEELRDPTKVYSWLMTTTNRESLRRAVEKARQLGREVEATELWDPAETPEETILWVEKQQMVRKLSDSLPSPCNLLLQALFFDDRTYEEAAELLDLSRQTIGPLRIRCLKRFRETLAEHGITSL